MSDSPRKTTLLVFLGILLIGGLAFFLGYASGSKDETAVYEEPASCEIPDDYFGSSPDLSRERNLVWHVMNERPEEFPASREGRIGLVLAFLLDPKSNEAQVQVAIGLWSVKGMVHLDPSEIRLTMQTIAKGTPEQRFSAFADLSAGDESASALINSVLADKERIRLFIAGEQIPYENGWSPGASSSPQDAGADAPTGTEPPEETGYHQDLQKDLENQHE